MLQDALRKVRTRYMADQAQMQITSFIDDLFFLPFPEVPQLPPLTVECQTCLSLAWQRLIAYLERDLPDQVNKKSSIRDEKEAKIVIRHFCATVSEPYGDVVNSQGVAQHLEIKSSSRPTSPFSLHQGTGVVVQSNHPTHVVVLQPTQLAHGRCNQFNSN